LKHLVLVVAALLIATGGPASAATLDFSDPQWSVDDGSTSHTFDTELGQVTISTLAGSSTSNGFSGTDARAYSFGEVLQLEFHDGIQLTEATFSEVSVWEAGGANTGESKTIFWGGGHQNQTVAFDERVSILRISSTWWDFKLHSLTATSLPSSAAAPMPEPEAAVLFPIGALIVGYAVHRQRRSNASA